MVRTRARRLVLGVDSSTQSTKVEARDVDTGAAVARASAPHPPTTPPVSEQDPTAWWEALAGACSQLDETIRRDVVAMAVAGQQHGLVLLDATGAPLRPAKLWNDTTSAPHADRLVAAWGATQWAQRTGSVPVAAFTVTKLAWVADHEPELLDDVAMVMLPHDYLTWRLTGEHVTDRGDASGTGWFDPVRDEIVPDAIEAAVGSRSAEDWCDRVPRVLAPWEAAGGLSAAAAAALGLPEHVVVGPGTGDNMGAALGLGLRPGDVAVSLGTSGTAFAVSSSPTHDPSGAVAGFADATGHHLPLVCTLNATKVTDAVGRWLGADAASLAELALMAVDEPASVAVVPYFDGERTPNLPDATGSVVGLTTSTTREQLALAAHDGVLCGLLDGVDALSAAGADIGRRLFLVGGGARSAAYRRRTADLSGRAVIVPDTDESVATGAAVQAAMVLDESTVDDDTSALDALVSRWGLGAGTTVEPVTDGVAVRERHRALVARAL